MQTPVLILGSDERSAALFRLLERQNRPVLRVSAPDDCEEIRRAVRESETIVLPIPATKDGSLLDGEAKTPWKEIFPLFDSTQTVWGGAFTSEQNAFFKERAVPCFDFLQNETFALYNAALTAQGALRLLLEHTRGYLPEQRILITGYGRVGKALSRVLRALGCDCFIAARSALQRQEAVLAGCKAHSPDDLSRVAFLFDIICNTVPARLFSLDTLRVLRPGCLFLELASAPFGTDPDDCVKVGVIRIAGGGLPGRFTPDAAAGAMLRCIDSEREVIPWIDPSSATR